MYKHLAFDIESGEIISAERGHVLKRAVRTTQRINHKYGFPAGRWIFAHDGNVEKLIEKAKR